MLKTDDELTAALQGIGSEFRDNELAYLALTVKIELPFRDRLAFYLHKRYENTGYTVAREWNRVDLAIVDSANKASCLVQLKAMYTYDAFGTGSGYGDKKTVVQLTEDDERKAWKSVCPHTAVDFYSLLLATHPTSAIDRKHEKIIKYRTGINEALDKYKNEAKVREKAIAKVACDLGTRTLVAQGEVPGGRAFEVGVSVLYWLVSSAGPPAKHNVAEEDQA